MIIPKFPTHKNIPENAECVFSWVRSEVYQWDQKMYDGTLARFERIRFLDGAFVIPITPEWNILLTIQEQPWRKEFISLPGGSFDSPLEEPLLCAQRELLEETGYVSDNWKFWHSFEGTGNVVTHTYFYIAHDVSWEQAIRPDAWEKIELFEVTFDEFLELTSDKRFHHHWNLLPILYEARLSQPNRDALRQTLYEK